ncbi:MAG TPA: hypothetical protein PLZ55_05815, partial [bacterium]|nr:hypothetical protein [bacterium]
MDVERRLLKLVLFILISCMFVSFCIGGHSEELKNPATQAACRFADALLTYAADHYGPQQTPFFVQMLELDTLTLPAVRTEQGWRPRTSGEWQEAMKNWPDDPQYTMWGKWFSNVGIAHTANFSNDLYTVQGLYELTDVTGDSRYRKAAEDYYRFFLEHMVSPVTGFWAWGFHMSWDVLTDELRGNRHELERVIPPWDVLWKFDSKAVTGEIAGLYAHVKDKETFAFDRHARFTDFFPESETNGYNEYAMRYINAWIYLYVKTGDSKYLDWAHRMLLSRRSKTADITDVFPYLWNPDLDRPIGLGWQNSLNIATYLLDAYRLYPDPWLLDPALQIVSRYQGGAPVNWGGETFGVDAGARALPLAYEITRDPHIRQQMLTAAEAFLIAQPPEIQMAQSGGQNLFFLLDVYMATGDPKWWEACQNNLATTVKIFQHPSGLIRGTAGLKRPDFYDASQGSGDLFAAWTRTAYLERNPVLVGWQFPPAVSPGTKSVRIEARVHLPEKNPTVFLNYRFVDKGSYRRVAGKIENGTAIFLLPIPSGSKSPIEWRGEIGSPAMWHSGLFRIALTSDTTPPRIGKPTWDALMPNDEPATVAVPITDDTGLEQAILHYTYGDRIGFSDVVERPSNGDVRFKIRNDPAFEGTIAFFVEAVDSSPARNTSLSEWHSLKSYTRVRKEFDPNKGTQDTVAADLVLSLSCTIPLPVILERTPWVPTGATETNTGLRKYYHIQADRWAESVTAANMSVKLNPEDHVGIVPESIRFARWTDQWTDVPSRLDLTGGRVGTSEVSPGWWKIEALSRCKWTHSIMHGETAAPSLSDLDGDGTLEVVSAMGGGPPWGAILDAYGNELARLDVGERVRQSGNYSGVAVTDVDE